MACILAVHLRDDIFTRMSFYFIFGVGGMSRYRCVTAQSSCIRRFPDDSLLLWLFAINTARTRNLACIPSSPILPNIALLILPYLNLPNYLFVRGRSYRSF